MGRTSLSQFRPPERMVTDAGIARDKNRALSENGNHARQSAVGGRQSMVGGGQSIAKGGVFDRLAMVATRSRFSGR